jgi:NAD(P)H-hydrate epimerase
MDARFVLTREQSRRVDHIAIHEYGIHSLVLMENAGRGVVDVLLGIDPSLGRVRETHQPGDAGNGLVRFTHPSVAILCGKGNNAGDGFVIARHLAIRGVDARVVLLCPPTELAGDARVNYEILARAAAPLVDASAAALDAAALERALDRHVGGAAWLVDAMLGTGATGEPREPFRTAIAWMNRQSGRRLAVDVPSGLDCDTGAAAAATVRASVTCTFVAAKPGLVAASTAEFVGQLHVVSIGVPETVVRQAARG